MNKEYLLITKCVEYRNSKIRYSNGSILLALYVCSAYSYLDLIYVD